ncbi:MAG: nucleotidyltransferase family protein [Elusimicrobia bacterium]|nr:nucleotidyltransferase family protein [Elusimicrobiota bacterium]
MGREEILKTIQAHGGHLRLLGVRRLGLFGSYARGQASRSSDMDFLVEFEEKSFDAYMDLKDYLEKLFHRRVDLVLRDAIKPRLRPAILREVVYAQGL